MVNVDLQGASQPTDQNGLNQAFNPTSKTAYGSSASQASQQPNSQAKVDQRTKHGMRLTLDDIQQPRAMGATNTSPHKGQAISASAHAHNYSYQSKADLGAIQMRAPIEWAASRAVESNGGGSNTDNSVVGEGLAHTKREQDEELKGRRMKTSQEIQQEGKEDWRGKKSYVNVAEALAGRGSKVVLAAEN